MRNLIFLLFGSLLIPLTFLSCEKEEFSSDDTTYLTTNQMTTLDHIYTGTDLSVSGKKNNCNTIPGGEIYDSDGDLIEPGYNEWGYNYQARIFNGGYCDAYKNAAWCQEYADVNLIMKWNDAWMSNKDCDLDGLLDRHYGFDSYIGSGAWLTNHQSGTYLDEDGNECHWTYFVKIVAAPADATALDGYYYNADGTEIGPQIWGSFAIIQQVENDPCAGINGLQYLSPDHAGLGNW